MPSRAAARSGNRTGPPCPPGSRRAARRSGTCSGRRWPMPGTNPSQMPDSPRRRQRGRAVAPAVEVADDVDAGALGAQTAKSTPAGASPLAPARDVRAETHRKRGRGFLPRTDAGRRRRSGSLCRQCNSKPLTPTSGGRSVFPDELSPGLGTLGGFRTSRDGLGPAKPSLAHALPRRAGIVLGAVLVAMLSLTGGAAQARARATRPPSSRRARRSPPAVSTRRCRCSRSCTPSRCTPSTCATSGAAIRRCGSREKAIDAFKDYLAKAKKVPADDRKEVEGFIKEMETLRDEQAKTAQTPAPPVVTPTPCRRPRRRRPRRRRRSPSPRR